MYRSNTGDFLLSLTPFKSFENDYLYECHFLNRYHYLKESFMDKNSWVPPINYSDNNNFELKQILCNSYGVIMNDNYFLYKRRSTHKFTYDQYINIKEILKKYNLEENNSLEDNREVKTIMGMCLYKVNLDNFKITKYKYIHTFGLLYDILNSYENCNYFMKIIDNYSISYILIDKLIINSFINLLCSQLSYNYPNNYYKTIISILNTLYYLLSYQLKYQKFLFDKITDDFEIIRNEFNKNKIPMSLQINFKEVGKKLGSIRVRDYIINSTYNSILEYLIANINNLNGVFKLIRFENYNITDILKRFEFKSRYVYKDFIIYEKDISYHIYDWMILLNIYLYFNYPNIKSSKSNMNLLSSIFNDEKISIFLNSLKNYEKSKYFIIRENITNKILNSGISF